MEYKVVCNISRPGFIRLRSVLQTRWKGSFSSSTDGLVESLAFEAGSKREFTLLKYFNSNFQKSQSIESQNKKNQLRIISDFISSAKSDLLTASNVMDIVKHLERNIDTKVCIPNDTLNYLLVYFAKNGNISGVEAVQIVVKKYNASHFSLQSEYKHYMAEALWINGKVEDSLKLFLAAYDNSEVRDKVKLMLTCLFPILISHHSHGTLQKTIYAIEKLSLEKEDHILLGYLWKELFQSDLYSDQQIAKEVLQKNLHLLQVIQWMIPAMGRDFLMNHKVDSCYRLIEFTLEHKLVKLEGILLRHLFDYYYMHRNIKRCSEVVKYSNNRDFPLSEDQLRRYVSLLLKSKDSLTAKSNIKPPQSIKYKF